MFPDNLLNMVNMTNVKQCNLYMINGWCMHMRVVSQQETPP